jgi:SAM-dependent methyltransferase
MELKAGFDPIRYWNDRVHPEATLADTGVQGYSLNYNKKLYQLKTMAFKRILTPYADSFRGQPVLNVGCGIGFFENWLERVYDMRASGVDVSLKLVEALKRRYSKRHYEYWDFADGASPNLPMESFQLITFIDVLYHIIDDQRWFRTVQNAVCHLRLGGFVLITDITNGQACSAPHVRFRSLEAYEEILSACRLQKVSQANMYYLFNRFRRPWANPNAVMLWFMFLADLVLTPYVSSNNMVAMLFQK